MVVVYEKTKSHCGDCENTKRWLDLRGIEHITKSVEDHMEEALTYLPDALAAPIVVTSTGDAWCGFRLNKLKELLNEESS